MDCFVKGRLAIAMCFSYGLFPNEMFSGHQTFFMWIVSQKDTWRSLGVSLTNCFSKGHLVVTRCFSHGLFPKKMFGGHRAFLPVNVFGRNT
jgi:hypothetical protein